MAKQLFPALKGQFTLKLNLLPAVLAVLMQVAEFRRYWL